MAIGFMTAIYAPHDGMTRSQSTNHGPTNPRQHETSKRQPRKQRSRDTQNTVDAVDLVCISFLSKFFFVSCGFVAAFRDTIAA